MGFDVRKGLESQISVLSDGMLRGRMDMTFGDLISIYLKVELRKLELSTKSTNTSMAKQHVRPHGEDYRISAIDANVAEEWLPSVTLDKHRMCTHETR